MKHAGVVYRIVIVLVATILVCTMTRTAELAPVTITFSEFPSVRPSAPSILLRVCVSQAVVMALSSPVIVLIRLLRCFRAIRNLQAQSPRRL